MSDLDPATFEPPGPGSWVLDAVHADRPFSTFQAEIHPPNLALGFREAAHRYGLLIDTLNWRVVNGFAYFAPAPASEDSFPERFAAAEAAFADRLWRRDLERWEEEVKPASVAAHRHLQAIDPSTLDADALLSYIDDCRDHLQAMIQQHHRFNAAAMLPVGDLIAQVSGWTGRPMGDVLALLRGEAPESAGATQELDRLADAIRASDEARALLERDDAAAVIRGLRAMPGDVGDATTAYVDLVGYRLLDSLDTGDPYALEMPEVLVNGVRLAVESGAPASSSVPDEELARVKDEIAPEHRASFDELLAEARYTSRLRDERGLYSDVWAGGIMRRALLAAGERLAEKGRLEAPEHLVECGYDEIRSLTTGGDGPSADELSERARYRATHRAADAPPFLGDPPQPPPPLDGLPPAVARAMAALGAAIDSLFGAPTAESDATVVRGAGASPGVYTGRARLIRGPSEFGRLEPGDVLVTAATTESFNIVLPLVAAIVTDSGGLLSHAAIVAREFGIPGVVGCGDATTLITDGAMVRVDGSQGAVTVM